MNNSYTKIINEMEENLKKIEDKDNFLHYEKAIHHCSHTLNKLQQTINKIGFQNTEEEIYFFKYIKPQAYSTMAFYRMLTIIETHCPQYSIQDKISFFQDEIHKTRSFFETHNEFVEYYRTGQTYADEKYFTRNFSNLIFNNDNFEYIIYPDFSTVHDGTVAKIMAYEKLEQHLSSEILKLQNPELLPDKYLDKPQHEWTENLTSLAELLYSLKDSKAINHGNISVKELIELFCKVLNVPEGNIYNAFRLVQNRKKEKTVFLDKLKMTLEHKIDMALE